MDLNQAEGMTRELMNDHGLEGWTFAWDYHKSRYGSTNSARRIITLSKPLTYHRELMHVRNTILHEIAHAIVGVQHGHNIIWKTMAQRIGADGKRCSTDMGALAKVSKYKVVCMHESAHVLGYVQTRRFKTAGRRCKEHQLGIVLRPNL
jgi:predicted SprT family Zn-dependent metalloprotease